MMAATYSLLVTRKGSEHIFFLVSNCSLTKCKFLCWTHIELVFSIQYYYLLCITLLDIINSSLCSPNALTLPTNLVHQTLHVVHASSPSLSESTRLLMNSWWGKEAKKVQPSPRLPKNVTCSALWATMSHCSLQGSKEILGGKSNTEPVCMSEVGTFSPSYVHMCSIRTKSLTRKQTPKLSQI